MFWDNKLSVQAGLRPCITERAESLQELCKMVTLSCFLGTKFLKDSTEIWGQMKSIGVLHSPVTLLRTLLFKWNGPPTPQANIIVKKVLVELSLLTWVSDHWLPETKICWSEASFRDGLLHLTWEWQNYKQRYQSSVNSTVMSLPSSEDPGQPHHERGSTGSARHRVIVSTDPG